KRFTTIEDRFWSKVAKGEPDECWPWTASKDGLGYGLFGKDRRVQKAHRVAFELTSGPISEGAVICHSCDNPPCCNPAHLWSGTRSDNARDMVAKGRAKIPSLLGERHGMARLKECDIIAIRASKKTQSHIASEFGISQAAVSSIKARKR